MTDYSPRNVFQAFVRETVYQKLAGTNPDQDGMIWLNIMDVVRHVDPQEFNRSKYSKYVLVAHLKMALLVLEDQAWITTRGSQYAIHVTFMEFMNSNDRETVDAYMQTHLKDSCYG